MDSNAEEKIRAQIEFYFSERNLAHDKFLLNEIKKNENGWIPVSLFLKFNRIRTLTKSTDQIKIALQKSTLLEVSEDGSQLCQRQRPLLKSASTSCEAVKAPESQEPSTSASALFDSSSALVSPSEQVDDRTVYIDRVPEHVLSVRDPHAALAELLRAACPNVHIIWISLPRFKTTNDMKGFAFVELASSAECDSLITAVSDQSEQPVSSSQEIRFPKTNKDLERLERQARRLGALSESDSGESHPPAAKKTKLDDACRDAHAETPASGAVESHRLHIVTKREWLRLRSEYIAAQKQRMSDLKRTLREFKSSRSEMRASDQQSSSEPQSQPQPTSTSQNVAHNSATEQLPFVAGCVVRIDTNATLIKRDLLVAMAGYERDIAYVEAGSGTAGGTFVRCIRSDCELIRALLARSISLPTSENYKVRLLEGDEEREYWERLQRERSEKHNHKVPRQKKRGRQKLMERAANAMQKIADETNSDPSERVPAHRKHAVTCATKIIFED